MDFVRFTNLFRSVERTIWYHGVEDRERNGEHSFQVALVAWFMNEHFTLGLDMGKLIRYALVHDIPEVWAGDTPNFPDPRRPSQPTPADKKGREMKALRRIEHEWGAMFPELVELLYAYERQEDAESRFIRSMEKLISTINIYQDSGRTWQELKVELEPYLRFKRDRINGNPFVQRLWRELEELLRQEEHLFASVD